MRFWCLCHLFIHSFIHTRIVSIEKEFSICCYWPITLPRKSAVNIIAGHLRKKENLFRRIHASVWQYMPQCARRGIGTFLKLKARLIITAHAHSVLNVHTSERKHSDPGMIAFCIYVCLPFVLTKSSHPPFFFFLSSGARCIVDHTTLALRIAVNAGIITSAPGLHTPLLTPDHEHHYAPRFHMAIEGCRFLRRGHWLWLGGEGWRVNTGDALSCRMLQYS